MPDPAAARKVSLQEAKAHLESLLAEVVQQASEVLITRAGAPVARLVPSSDPGQGARERFFARAASLRRHFGDMAGRELDARIDRALRDVRRRHAGRP